MELRDIARARRRQQVLEALELERDREAALRGQVEEVATDLEGDNVDEETFAGMDPEDVSIVRSSLDTDQDFGETSAEAGEDWLAEFVEESPGFDREELLGEVARLEREINGSRRRQQALERYLEALAAPEG